MTRMFVNTKIRMMKALEAREAGQGTLEYLGIIVVVALLIRRMIAGLQDLGPGHRSFGGPRQDHDGANS